MKPSAVFGLFALALLGACSSNDPAQPSPAVGSDRDAHGCIASAGYAWCAKTQRCERPWQLAQERGFANKPEEFERFCRAP